MDWASLVPVGLLFVLILLLIVKRQYFWKSHVNKNLPPGPKPLPIIGNLHILDLKKLDGTMIKLSETYGPVFRIQMGPKTVVVLSGYDTVKEALVNHADAFAGRPKIQIIKETAKGKGVIFSYGENWKVMRRFTLTTLRDFGMGKKAIEDRVVEEYGYLADVIESQKGKPLEMTLIMNAAVANVIVSILLGKRYDYEDPTFKRLLSLMNENIRLFGRPSVSLYNIFPALGFFLKDRKAFLKNVKEVNAFIKVTFIEHLKVLDRNDQRSFIDAFLVRQQEFYRSCKNEAGLVPTNVGHWNSEEHEPSSRENGKDNGFFDNENLTEVVRNLFAAGTDTTSTTLRWGLLLMMKYPEIQKKVQEEIEQVLGSNPPRTEHRTQMPYTDAVIHEIQRFANILPLSLPHDTTADVNLKGYFIPKGTYIIPLLISVLQDKSQWEKPEMFYPEHFLDSKGKFVKKDAFMPFSAGRRICAGETLAKMELFLFFTSLLQRFTFHPPPGVSASDLDLNPAISFNVIPKPYKICAVARS
uniref:Cytochrome P450 n=1 Tax=Anser cygnoides TaxID=8845 RepID=A0A8B9EIP7_ANSCY